MFFLNPSISITCFCTLFSIAAAAVSRIIYKDVAILGGGASGSHAAVRLREDFNRSIIIIERQENLGGHVETYTDPVTRNPYDYGVNSYTEYGKARKFFARFNVSLVNPTSLKLNTSYIDFTSGKLLPGYLPPVSADVTAALTRYLDVTSKYEDMVIPSYERFPAEVPDELLTRFSDIVIKYSLQACLPLIYQITGFGLGNMADELFLFVMSEFSAPMARVVLGQKNSWVPSTHRNQDLYDKIAELLDGDVLYSTTVIKSNRTSKGVELLVRNTAGETNKIIAKKLLVSFALTPDNTASLALSSAEKEIFSKWKLSHGYCGIVTSSALSPNTSLINLPNSAAPQNYLAFHSSPFVVRYQYLGDTNFRILITGTENFTLPLARTLAQETFQTLIAAGNFPQIEGGDLDFKAFQEHTTTKQFIPIEDVRNGFYKKLYALQGERSTWYTGRAWSGQFTTILWEFNDVWLLPRLLDSF
ncbi:hypothetical protein HYFRA_00013474 [Hymenoscyphus fraxineus]|uniref:Amine oxidase n=1 Tax=Hymenoscyphus fraxineus TaxID=746836 RepID=A0A9N9LAL2_9HELO|nr:hypothetical protein HYFRA_00013474 [Hymenoscyphus fraxineus]